MIMTHFYKRDLNLTAIRLMRKSRVHCRSFKNGTGAETNIKSILSRTLNWGCELILNHELVGFKYQVMLS